MANGLFALCICMFTVCSLAVFCGMAAMEKGTQYEWKRPKKIWRFIRRLDSVLRDQNTIFHFRTYMHNTIQTYHMNESDFLSELVSHLSYVPSYKPIFVSFVHFLLSFAQCSSCMDYKSSICSSSWIEMENCRHRCFFFLCGCWVSLIQKTCNKLLIWNRDPHHPNGNHLFRAMAMIWHRMYVPFQLRNKFYTI